MTNLTILGTPVEKKEVLCCFGEGNRAIGRWSMSEGCVCRTLDREQDLCMQHAGLSGYLGTFELIVVYSPEAFNVVWPGTYSEEVLANYRAGISS